jgi:K+-transporting ATPase c subunit
MFDRMHHRLHDIAIERPGDDKSTPRKEYTLDAVPKSGGGLNDDVSAPVAINNVLRVRTFAFLSLSIWPMFKTKSRIESS